MPIPKRELIPAVLAKTPREFKRKLDAMRGLAPCIHVDAMDGIAVPNTTWFDPNRIAGWHADELFELHLMVRDPLTVASSWMRVRGFRRMIVGLGPKAVMRKAIGFARERCLELGVAVLPDAAHQAALDMIGSVDEILVLGGQPGFSGKDMDRRALETVRAIRRHTRTLPIGFDIGVNRASIPMLRRAGVTRFRAASAIFNSDQPQRAYSELRKMLVRARGGRI